MGCLRVGGERFPYCCQKPDLVLDRTALRLTSAQEPFLLIKE